MGISQGEAVFQAVSMVVNIEGKVLDYITPSQTKEVHDLVFKMFKEGVTSHSKNPVDEVLRKYIPGLVNNWLRKDRRLNGGSEYVSKNPGSRSGDDTLKNLRLLLGMVTDPTGRSDIQREIEKREAELKPKVNVDFIPEYLRQYVK